MIAEVQILDEQVPGDVQERFTLRLASEKVTARELLRRRIFEEVADYNQRRPEHFQGLIRPSAEEQILNSRSFKKRKPVDGEKQFEAACRAFEANGFLMFFDDEQVVELDQELVLAEKGRLRFLKLVPLVGG